MDGRPKSVTQQCGDDYLRRDYYTLNAMVEMEDANSPVTKVHEYWLDLKNGAAIAPKADAFMSSKLWEMKIPDRVTIIDCSAENPLDFKFARHAYDVSDNDWIFGGRITGKSISRIPSSTLLGALEGDYLFAKSFPDSAMLRYTGIRQQINGVHRDFTRLLLPFTGVNNDVSMLVAVTRLRNPTVIDNNMGPHSKN